jgi:hypothetical protein
MVTEIIYPVLVLLLVTFLVAAVRVTRYTAGVRKTLSQVNRLVRYTEELPVCDKGNLDLIDKKMPEIGEEDLKEVWKRFRQDGIFLMGGEVVPEPGAYFNYEELVSVPRGRRVFQPFGSLYLCFPAWPSACRQP